MEEKVGEEEEVGAGMEDGRGKGGAMEEEEKGIRRLTERKE